jgi:uncharacterized protein YyaL (SSP411 family)
MFEYCYGVSRRGNFEGSNILSVVRNMDEVAAQFRVSRQVAESVLSEACSALFASREGRIKPARDEKVLAEWNGLMIHALAECGARLQREDALQAAVRAADFVLHSMRQDDGRLLRSYKDGDARLNAYLEDYAAMARAAIALYEATFDLRWLAEASRLTQMIFDQFHDPVRGGFFQTGVDHETLVARRKDVIDNAIPSGNSLAAETLVKLSAFVDNDRYRSEARRICIALQEAMAQQPTGFGRMLGVTSLLLAQSREIVVAGEKDDEAWQALVDEARRRYLPATILAAHAPGVPTLSLPLLDGRELVDGKAAAYVCENYVCRLPVTTAEDLARVIGDQ